LGFSAAAYPSGWGGVEVRQACGPDADSFNLGQCSLGWAFYIYILGTAMAFVCVGMSIKAGKARPSSPTDHLNNFIV
ncbi:predicted protein, partial [Nematostella vectensis]